MFRPRSLVVAIFVCGLSLAPMHAQELRLPLPKRSKYTPVQKLNRDGVKAIEKHNYDKAKKLFYKAYLIDPNDPFTLNNLGYLAELEGDADRAQRFYQLASDQNSDAVVDMASNELVKGKPVSEIAGNAETKGIRINRLNDQAIALLKKDRAPEADLILQKALLIDAHNPFTLNNLGYAKEKEGELDAAYQFYTAAANTNSRQRVEIALDKDWRGREISDVARHNARKLDKRLRNEGDVESQVALLNLRGVSAFNRNDRRAAREFIKKAYKLDPNDAFTLNNMGFLAEMDGDRETADYYYDRARGADSHGQRVTLATRKDAEGKKIGELAENTDDLVLSRIDAEREARRREGGPVLLRDRKDNQPIAEPAKPVHTPQKYYESDANGNLVLPPRQGVSSSNPVGQGGIAMPLPDSQQPVTVHQGQEDHGMIMPLPDDQQPNNQQQQPQSNAPQPKQGKIDNGVMMPLPDTQQPGAAKPPQPRQGQEDHGMIMPLPDDQQPNAQQPGTQQPNNAPQAAPQPQQGQNNNGLLMPLPDDQQPANNSQPQQSQPPAPQSNPGLLLPPPDKQQQNQRTGTQPSQNPSNIGVYSPPPADRSYPRPATSTPPTRTVPRPPKKISDMDNTQPSTTKPKSNNGVTHISDQD